LGFEQPGTRDKGLGTREQPMQMKNEKLRMKHEIDFPHLLSKRKESLQLRTKLISLTFSRRGRRGFS